ncbi:hypothetical protein [Streptomyces sp. NPDC006552]|uniref:hypothetical protein n=1 Tax=Streptomyces sp. NPDC006552 TaxID=3157179 RepID=UPI00339DCAF2
MSFGPPPSPFTQSTRAADERARRRRVRVWASFAVALVVVAVGVGWVLRGVWTKDGSEPSRYDNASAQQAPDEVRATVERRPAGGAGRLVSAIGDSKLKPAEMRTTPGTWATDEVLAKGVAGAIQGFKIDADDELVWQRQLSGDICGWTQSVTVGGSTAVLFKGADHRCTELMFFNVNTGERIWQKSVPWKKDAFDLYPNVSLARGVVAVAYGTGSAGYDMTSGKKLWARAGTSACREAGFKGGRALLLRLDCQTRDGGTQYRVQRISLETGRPVWTYKTNEHLNFVYLVSAEPVVLAVSAGEANLSDLITLDEEGKYQNTIRFSGDHYEAKCESGLSSSAEDALMFSAVDQCSRIAVSDDQAFITTGEVTEGVAHETNSIVSFDLKTGHTGVKFDAGKDQELFPLRMSGDQLLALKVGTDTFAPTQLVGLDPKTGKESSYFFFSPFHEASILVDPDTSDIVVEHGRIFFGSRTVQGGGTKSQPAYTWRAFGVGRAQ